MSRRWAGWSALRRRVRWCCAGGAQQSLQSFDSFVERRMRREEIGKESFAVFAQTLARIDDEQMPGARGACFQRRLDFRDVLEGAQQRTRVARELDRRRVGQIFALP